MKMKTINDRMVVKKIDEENSSFGGVEVSITNKYVITFDDMVKRIKSPCVPQKYNKSASLF